MPETHGEVQARKGAMFGGAGVTVALAISTIPGRKITFAHYP